MAKGIRALLDTVIQALPQVGNLGLLFFLLFFIFAALGVELFGRLECSPEHPCEGLGIHAHFHNFGMAFLTLFRVATGDNWNGIMKDTLREDCDRSDNCLKNCCVSPLIAPVYFVVFVLMAQFVLVNVVVAVLMKHLEETYKYKELDDELEEELRAEMCALALAGKTVPGHSENKSTEAGSHVPVLKALDDDDNRDGDECNQSMLQEEDSDKCKGSMLNKWFYTFTDNRSFTGIVRPKESHRMMDDDAILLGETLIGSGGNRQDVENKDSDVETESQHGIAKTTPSFSFCVRPPSEEQSRSEDAAGPSPVNASGTLEALASSWSSMDSNRLAVTPSMTGSSPSSDHSIRISSPPIRRAASPYLLSLQGQSGSIQRRPLVKQYSMDVGSDPQLNNMNTGTNNDMWEKLTELHQPPCKQPDNNISRSQPSLKDIKGSSLEGKTGGSLDSKESSTTGERLPARDRIKHKLLRSRSSGAKYSRFRDKYKQSNLNKVVKLNGSETSLSKEKVKKTSQPGSNETGSDVDESIMSDWGSEEAACDLEVKMITGGTEDDEDDIRPTLSPYASEDREGGHLETCVRGLLESVASASQSSRGDSTPRAVKPAQGKSRSAQPAPSRTNPGIDNTSFELGEDIRLPPCCKARETAVVKRSNSFSPSKLTPKAFSPPMLLSPRSDRSLSPFGLREHTTAVSPLAMEDSTYRHSLTQSGRDVPLSPVSFAHSHMLTVPYAHSAYSGLHMRSPSPTPPKHGLLAQPTDYSHDNRWQPVGSPAPVRRQQTLSRSSAVDHDSVETSPLRRRIPHTLSMDSAFLVPPGLPSTFSINEPYLELHASCRAASPLPSPRNSQQTLPSMFTRSASTSAPQPWHISSQPQIRHQQSLPSHPATNTVTITHSSPEPSSCSQSTPVPAPSRNPTDSDPFEYEENLVTPTQEMRGVSDSSGALQQQKDDNSDMSGDKL